MTDKFYKKAEKLLEKLGIKTIPIKTKEDILNAKNFIGIIRSKDKS